MRKKEILLGLSLCCMIPATAQRRIVGMVTDAYQAPLPGATIVVKELPHTGAVANGEGYYLSLIHI